MRGAFSGKANIIYRWIRQMQTKIASSKKASEIKNAAIAIGVFGNDAKRLGDIAVTNKGLVWSKNSSKAAKDVTVKWDAFTQNMTCI